MLARRLARFPSIARCTFSTQTATVTFIDVEGQSTTIEAEYGETMLEVAQENDLDVEGACEGTMACSTCHMIFEKSVYDKLTAPEEEELDMLDLAVGLEDTSRLGCQVQVSELLDGATVRLPPETVNQL